MWWRPDKREEREKREERRRREGGGGEVLWEVLRKCCGLEIIVLTEILES